MLSVDRKSDFKIRCEHMKAASIINSRTHFLTGVLVAGLVVFTTTVASAQSADDVDCNKCINQTDIAFSAVGTGRIRAGAVNESRLADEAVTSVKIADSAIGNEKIGDNAIDSRTLLDDSVTNAKIANGAIENVQIRNRTVDARILANDAVITRTIEDGAVTAAKIGDGAVGSEKIQTAAVDQAQLADAAVSNTKVQDGAIDWEKLALTLQERIVDLETRLDAIENSGGDPQLEARVVALEDVVTDNTVLKLDGQFYHSVHCRAYSQAFSQAYILDNCHAYCTAYRQSNRKSYSPDYRHAHRTAYRQAYS